MNKRIITSSVLAASILSFGAVSCKEAGIPPSADVLIIDGTVYDGTGNKAFKGDIAIVADRIVYVGKAKRGIEKKCKAAKLIDAEGCIVSPGFIDPHNHIEKDVLKPGSEGTQSYLRMGVTTAIFGQCGGSQFPLSDFYEKVENGGVALNVASFTGHNTIRSEVMGQVNRLATDEEISRMKEVLRKDMEAGSLGLSTGLFYVPGCFSEKRETVELCRTAAEYNGIYTTHVRSETKYNGGVYASTLEALEIGREAGIPVNISHIKCLGRSVWGQSERIAALIEEYQSKGLKVSADQYPYLATGLSMSSAITPAWSRDGGVKGLRERLKDPATLAKIKAEMPELINERGGAEGIFISANAGEFTGMTLAEAAAKTGLDPINTALSIISNENLNPYVNTFGICDEDLEYYMKKDWVMTCTDGSYPKHPRASGTYALMIQKYVLEKKLISLERMIRRSSGQVAETYHIKDRGFIREGAFADLLVFRPEDIRANSTYRDAALLSTGFKSVIVNGAIAVENDVYQSTLSGRILRR